MIISHFISICDQSCAVCTNIISFGQLSVNIFEERDKENRRFQFNLRDQLSLYFCSLKLEYAEKNVELIEIQFIYYFEISKKECFEETVQIFRFSVDSHKLSLIFQVKKTQIISENYQICKNLAASVHIGTLT